MKRFLSRDNVAAAVVAVLALILAIIMDGRGMPQKWHAAIMLILLPPAMTIMGYRLWWARLSFWISLTICLVVHTLAVWVFFQYALGNVRIGTLFVIPFALVEAVILIIAVKKVSDKLTGEHKTVRLLF